MSEIFDKLLIRVIFTLYICLGFYLFKYSHFLFYPSHRKQILKKIVPNINYINSLNVFSRILGLAVIFSPFEFNEYIGMTFSTIHFFIWSSIGIIYYLISLSITDWVVFQKYTFTEEVEKKKNIAYGIISFANALSTALLIKHLFISSQYSIWKFFIFWVAALSCYCLITRVFKFYSPNSFSKLIIQKNGGLSFGYSGFLICHALIISSSLISTGNTIYHFFGDIIIKMAVGFALVPLLVYILKKIIPPLSFDHPLHVQVTDEDFGIYELLIFVFTGLIVAHLLHFLHFNLKFQLISLALVLFSYLYKILHVFLYPAPRKKFLSFKFSPINSLDLIHLLSRLIGIVIIYTNIYTIDTVTQFTQWAVIGFFLYLFSLFITENIIFFNFGYHDEIYKNKNYAYIIVNFFNAICQGLIISKVLISADSSFMSLIIFWLESLVFYGLSTKLFKYVYDVSFDSLMIQKSLSLGIIFSGFLVGNTFILMAALTQETYDITGFVIQVLLKVNLGMIIMPLFLYGLKYVFNIQESKKIPANDLVGQLGRAISLFSVYLVAALLSSIIIGQIHFGTIYPFF